jgi:hypothetical protein
MEEPWLLPQTLTTLHVPLAVKCVKYHDSFLHVEGRGL